MPENILSESKEREITLADGKIYKMAPFDLNMLTDLEDAFGYGIGKIAEGLSEGKQATTLRLLLFTFLSPNYPDMTIQDVGKLVPLNNIDELMKTLTEVLTG